MAGLILDRIRQHGSRTALIDTGGTYTYADLFADARAIAFSLQHNHGPLQGARVAFMTAPGREYVAALFGVWMAGGVGVPLCPTHPVPELQYVIRDCGALTVLSDAAHQARFGDADIKACGLESLLSASGRIPPHVPMSGRALILYTSGTTSRPKGVVLTHANLQVMIEPLIDSWGWTPEDHILHVLPLHHLHGVLNALLCCLWAGATCSMRPRFVPEDVWEHFREATLFMGVPTMYSKLLMAWRAASTSQRKSWAAHAAGMRLMISGSAALPRSVFGAWEGVTGHRLLERYGMTETGMVLSNPLTGERRAGTVGQPLPHMDVRLMDANRMPVKEEGTSGILHVRGPAVFGEYWNRPDATREAFHEGWFRTGDVAVVVEGYYRILGRESVDIIKTGGYKVSALEVEEVLRRHAGIRECAVVGAPDTVWGERVCVAVVLEDGCTLNTQDLRQWASARLAPYKVPSRYAFVDVLPRNVMGKVFKPALQRTFSQAMDGLPAEDPR